MIQVQKHRELIMMIRRSSISTLLAVDSSYQSRAGSPVVSWAIIISIGASLVHQCSLTPSLHFLIQCKWHAGLLFLTLISIKPTGVLCGINIGGNGAFFLSLGVDFHAPA